MSIKTSFLLLQEHSLEVRRWRHNIFRMDYSKYTRKIKFTLILKPDISFASRPYSFPRRLARFSPCSFRESDYPNPSSLDSSPYFPRWISLSVSSCGSRTNGLLGKIQNSRKHERIMRAIAKSRIRNLIAPRYNRSRTTLKFLIALHLGMKDLKMLSATIRNPEMHR